MKLPQRICLASASLVLLGSSASLGAAGPASLGAVSDSRVGFLATGPAGMKIEGTTSDLKLVDSPESVVLTVPLANLTTGIALRDRHMKEKYLEVGAYPDTTLTIARSALKLPAGSDKMEGDVPATLRLHGQTRAVTVHYDASPDGDGYAAHGRFRVNMTYFGVHVPSYLGVTVKPDVDVFASFKVGRSAS
jgi:polyisoprenoid-binding protein YceI